MELTHGRGLDEETPGDATNRKADLDHTVLSSCQTLPMTAACAYQLRAHNHHPLVYQSEGPPRELPDNLGRKKQNPQEKL